MRPIFTIALLLGGCSLTASNTDAPFSRDGSTGDAKPSLAPSHVSLADWIQSADDYVEGTIVEVRAAWTPMYTYRPAPGSNAPWVSRQIDPSECDKGQPAVDVVLESWSALREGPSPAQRVVRLGMTSFAQTPLGGQPSGEVGSPTLVWPRPEDALALGDQIGATVYRHVGYPAGILSSYRQQPLLTIASGEAMVLSLIDDDFLLVEDPRPVPALDDLVGVSEAARWQRLRAAATEPALAAADYRRWLAVDTDNHPVYSYAALCTHLVGEPAPAEPCDTGIDAPDCDEH